MLELWTIGYLWTDRISNELFGDWKDWLNALVMAGEVVVPLDSALTDPNSEVQLHIFADASIGAYAAVANQAPT